MSTAAGSLGHTWHRATASAAHLLPHLRPGMSLLDVGSGAGTLTADLARAVAPGRVTAVEISSAALEQTRSGVEAASPDDQGGRVDQGNQGEITNVDYVLSDAHELRLADDHFDVVHAHQLLHHVYDPVEVITELRRVARPGGLISLREMDFSGFAWWPAEPLLDEWLALFLRSSRSHGGEPDAGRRLLSWARAADLTDVVASSSTWCFADPDGRELWAGSWADRLTDSALADQLISGGLATRDDLGAIARAWRRWAAKDDAWFSVLHAEVLARA